jgi:hypothetical protein
MIKLTNILKEILLEDRCKRIADRRYSKPSAYKSGAIVRCRKGNIWKGLKEEISASEAFGNLNSINTLVDRKRDIAFISRANTSEKEWESVLQTIDDNKFKVMNVRGNPNSYVVYIQGSESKANELKSIAEKYGGILPYNATEEDSRRAGELLGYRKEDIDDYIINNKQLREIDEAKETLRTWFKSKGAPGKTGGWVDCNTCRKVDGKTKCKPCGRQKGEKRAKYPSCRPTPSQCKQPGKGKKWGKTK